MPQLADIISLGFPLLGVKGSLPVGGASSDWPAGFCPSTSMKSWLWNPLSELPWPLGSSLCHVFQSEPRPGRITQPSMGGKMTIIRLHSPGPLFKERRKETRGA